MAKAPVTVVLLNDLQFDLYIKLIAKANDKGVIPGAWTRDSFKNNVVNALVRHGALKLHGVKEDYKATGADVQLRPEGKKRTPKAAAQPSQSEAA